MSFSETAERAFASRRMPTELIGRTVPSDWYSSDENDALWFAERDWQNLTSEDWILHGDAIFRFTHEAFAYYLPSLLTISIKAPDQWMKAADAVVSMLENGGALQSWGYAQKSGFVGFSCDELATIREWLVFFQNRETYNEPYGTDRISRALTSLDVLREQAGCTRG